MPSILVPRIVRCAGFAWPNKIAARVGRRYTSSSESQARRNNDSGLRADEDNILVSRYVHGAVFV
jgi:hypothetical protein